MALKTLEQLVADAPKVRKLLKDLEEQVKSAEAALADVRRVAKAKQALADLEWELQDLLKAAEGQLSARSTARCTAKPATLTAAEIRKTPEYRRAKTDMAQWLVRQDIAAMAEKKLRQQVATGKP